MSLRPRELPLQAGMRWFVENIGREPTLVETLVGMFGMTEQAARQFIEDASPDVSAICMRRFAAAVDDGILCGYQDEGDKQ